MSWGLKVDKPALQVWSWINVNSVLKDVSMFQYIVQGRCRRRHWRVSNMTLIARQDRRCF